MVTVYVFIGSSGEFSSLNVWVAGVYDDKAAAITAAEEQLAEDRVNCLVWAAWAAKFHVGCRISESVLGLLTQGSQERRDEAIALGLPPEPPMGDNESDYTVACVPMNQRGVWSYLDPDKMPPDA